ncbi:MAG: Rrf2 family transcriptional regulator [Chloroflexota bacterium]|nr:Rrf2 family transcriptional regulator [Chloroflexota bacterium]
MRVSSRADYGVRALFDLAQRYGQGPTQSRDIAARQGIPEAYLHQLLGALNRAGFVRSTRGPLGGHEIARDPAEITVLDVLHVLDGPDRRAHPHPGSQLDGHVIHQTWHELQSRSEAFLASISLRLLVERAQVTVARADYSI